MPGITIFTNEKIKARKNGPITIKNSIRGNHMATLKSLFVIVVGLSITIHVAQDTLCDSLDIKLSTAPCNY